jgi:hypothetical protein
MKVTFVKTLCLSAFVANELQKLETTTKYLDKFSIDHHAINPVFSKGIRQVGN